MISTDKANYILNGIFGRGTTNCYLGFSTTPPQLNDSGVISNFTEPDASTGYKRVPLTDEALSSMDAASGAQIKNGKYNIAFPVPNKESQYGTATHIGVFEVATGGTPTITAALSAPQALGLKATLVLYKNDFTATLTATDTASNAAG